MGMSPVVRHAEAAFAFTLANGLPHAYTIRYSYRLNPAPNKDKVFTLVQIHIVSVGVILLYVGGHVHVDDRFTWTAFVAQAAVIGNATGHSGEVFNGEDSVVINWGQGPWLVLGAGVVKIGWLYEAVRWRNVL